MIMCITQYLLYMHYVKYGLASDHLFNYATFVRTVRQLDDQQQGTNMVDTDSCCHISAIDNI